mmetsp:Transcript_21817/g.44958  ORF Transcript_21817/g.44958 Transcript_21817/m.44958 type:complete len:104 (+) Transcript_21817:215-526(+)
MRQKTLAGGSCDDVRKDDGAQLNRWHGLHKSPLSLVGLRTRPTMWDVTITAIEAVRTPSASGNVYTWPTTKLRMSDGSDGGHILKTWWWPEDRSGHLSVSIST